MIWRTRIDDPKGLPTKLGGMVTTFNTDKTMHAEEPDTYAEWVKGNQFDDGAIAFIIRDPKKTVSFCYFLDGDDLVKQRFPDYESALAAMTLRFL